MRAARLIRRAVPLVVLAAAAAAARRRAEQGRLQQVAADVSAPTGEAFAPVPSGGPQPSVPVETPPPVLEADTLAESDPLIAPESGAATPPETRADYVVLPEPDPVPERWPEPAPLAPLAPEPIVAEPTLPEPVVDPEPEPIVPERIVDPEREPIAPEPIAPESIMDPEPEPIAPESIVDPEPITPEALVEPVPEPEVVEPPTQPEPFLMPPASDPEPEPLEPITERPPTEPPVAEPGPEPLGPEPVREPDPVPASSGVPEPEPPPAEPLLEPDVVAESEPWFEPAPDPGVIPSAPAGDEAPTAEVPVVSDERAGELPPPPGEERVSVTDIVDDLLLAPDVAHERIEDATVVEGSADEFVASGPGDAALGQAVRAKLAEQPGLLPGTVNIHVEAGVAVLTGEVKHDQTIQELVRRSGSVPGVADVRNLLHLPGMPPPADR